MQEKEINAFAAQTNLFLKELKLFLNKLRFCRFTTRGINSSDIDGLFGQIDSKRYRFLKSGEASLTQDDIDKLNTIFNHLSDGISYELCFDLLIVFRESLIFHLKEILSLIEYWKFELNNYSWWERAKKNFWAQEYEEKLKQKIKNLDYLKDRVASFLGKTDDIITKFFKGAQFSLDCDEKDSVELSRELSLAIKEAVFCFDSFFSQRFDPDKNIYSQKITDFYKLPLVEVNKLLCKNHTNIQLMEDCFDFQLKDYQVPSFLRRHWFAMSVLGVGSVAGGIYLYKNWDYLTSDDETSPKKRSIKILNDTTDWLKTSFFDLKNMVEEKFSTEAKPKENQVKNMLEEPIRLLEETKELFEGKCQETIGYLEQNHVFDNFPIQENVSEIKRLMDALKAYKTGTVQHGFADVNDLNNQIRGQSQVLQQNITTFFQALGVGGNHAGNVGQNTPQVNPPVVNLSWVGKKFVGKDISQTLSQAIPVIQNWIDGLNRGLNNVNTNNLDRQTVDSLNNLIKGFTDMINHLPSVAGNLGNYGQLYEAIVFRLLADILNLLHKGVNVSADRLEGIARTSEVTLNWVKALVPVLLLVVVAPTTFVLIAKKILKDREKARYDKVSSVVSEIYRILNCYNSVSFDCYYKDLSYKDRGLIGFWIERLEKRAKRIFNSDRQKLIQLIADLQNPSLSIIQKIEFIKLEWGKNLFGYEALA